MVRRKVGAWPGEEEPEGAWLTPRQSTGTDRGTREAPSGG